MPYGVRPRSGENDSTISEPHTHTHSCIRRLWMEQHGLVRLSTCRHVSTPTVPSPASHHQEPGACSRPLDGDARRRNRPIPADMATAASQSGRLTLTCRLMTFIGEDEEKLQSQDGL